MIDNWWLLNERLLRKSSVRAQTLSYLMQADHLRVFFGLKFGKKACDLNCDVLRQQILNSSDRIPLSIEYSIQYSTENMALSCIGLVCSYFENASAVWWVRLWVCVCACICNGECSIDGWSDKQERENIPFRVFLFARDLYSVPSTSRREKKAMRICCYLTRYRPYTANWKCRSHPSKIQPKNRNGTDGQTNRKSKAHMGSNAGKQPSRANRQYTRIHWAIFHPIHRVCIEVSKLWRCPIKRLASKCLFLSFRLLFWLRCYCCVMVLYKQIRSYLVNIQ